MLAGDTICAVSSAVGAAARMIVRASGPAIEALARHVGIDLLDVRGGSAVRATLSLRGMPLFAWVYLFRAPRSYTGEDLLELHIPGNPLLARMLLDELVAAGARPAEAGEFTARAYLHGRLDLSAAEGVAATIAARGREELDAARRLLAGELARRLRGPMDLLADTLALVEVGIDFVEEDVTFLSAADVRERVGRIDDDLARLLADSARFERLAHEPTVVLAGRPNAGKSTLLNALAGAPRAVVSDVAGTTRDALSAEVPLARGLVRLIDVAGLEDAPPPAGEDAIAAHMRDRALRAAQEADVVLLVRDVTDDRPDATLPRPPDLVVRTKADLAPACAFGESAPTVSARTGLGIDRLRERLDRLCFGDDRPQRASGLALNARHVRAVEEARQALARAADVIDASPEVLAAELRCALDALGSVLGQVTPDDLLGRIFGAFCIGK